MRRRLPSLLLALCTVAIVGAAVVAVSRTRASADPVAARATSGTVSGLPPVPQATPGNDRLLLAINKAQMSVRRDKACRPGRTRPFPTSRPTTPNDGTPSQTILATFGVFRLRQAQEPTQQLPRFLQGDVYAKYIRVAQRRFGYTFEVAVTPDGASAPLLSARCQELETKALNMQLAKFSQAQRDRALQLAHDERLDEQYIHRHPETICTIGGGAGCLPFLYAQADGGLGSSGTGNEGSLWSYLVPDGVATVVAHYPAEGPKTGFLHHWPRITIAARVINNIAVWSLKSEPGDIFPSTITWRSANGKTVKIAYPG
jgi:hypothetical protein